MYWSREHWEDLKRVLLEFVINPVDVDLCDNTFQSFISQNWLFVGSNEAQITKNCEDGA